MNEVAQLIGARVREERKRQGLDQETLAMVANVGVRSVHKIESGTTTIRLDILLRILAALGLSLDLRSRDTPS